MDKTQLLDAIRSTHAPIEAAVAVLSDDELMEESIGMPGWTRKDVVAHVEWWNRRSIAVILGSRSGVDPFPGGESPFDLDAWNAGILRDHRERTAHDVRAGEAASFRELLAAVEEATPEELFREDPHPWLDGTVAETIADDTITHYPEHVPHLA